MLNSGYYRACKPKSALLSSPKDISWLHRGERNHRKKGVRSDAKVYSPPCTRRSCCEPHLPPWLRLCLLVPFERESELRCCCSLQRRLRPGSSRKKTPPNHRRGRVGGMYYHLGKWAPMTPAAPTPSYNIMEESKGGEPSRPVSADDTPTVS